MSQNKALVTGIAGQDGSWLAELLLSRDYDVHGVIRGEQESLENIEGIQSSLKLHAGSLERPDELRDIVRQVQPDECYHLAAMTFVSYRPEDDVATLNANVGGTAALLNAVREFRPACRFIFASSSEVFGETGDGQQNETTPFHPRSVYGVSKAAGSDLTRISRDVHGLFAASAFLFNHESSRRGRAFVTRKITATIAEILAGRATELRLGQLDAERDWGHARDYVRAMWLMAQQPVPRDFVIATGRIHTVREFVDLAFSYAGLDPARYVVIDPALFRPASARAIRGDSSRARQALGWTPEISFEDLVREMVESDCRAAGVSLSRGSRISPAGS